MTPDTGDDARRLLADSRHLARRVRLAQRVTWFPLLVLAVVMFVAIPVFRFSPRVAHCATDSTMLGGTVCAVYRPVQFVYWPVALVLAYTSIAWCYLRVARTRGLGGRVMPYVVAGIVLTALATVASLWGEHLALLTLHHLPARVPGPLWAYRLGSPFGAVGLALLVLAWLERHLALMLFTLGYLTVVVVPVRFGFGPAWAATWGADWGFAPPLIINGSVLLLGGLGFALAQRQGWYR